MFPQYLRIYNQDAVETWPLTLIMVFLSFISLFFELPFLSIAKYCAVGIYSFKKLTPTFGVVQLAYSIFRGFPYGNDDLLKLFLLLANQNMI